MSAFSSVGSRITFANNLAAHARLQRKDLHTGGYTLASWQRLDAPGEPIHLYIEGDGLAWLSRRTPSLDPTPTQPVALELAALDPAPNVVYLARPCQYIAQALNPGCHVESWTGGRFSAKIIQSMNAALSQISTDGHGGAFDLVGFSGGGNIALLLAARREDVASVRTVAGNIDVEAVNRHHKASAMPHSLNAADIAADIKSIPQIHFTGTNDEIIPPDIYEGYKNSAGVSSCIAHKVVSGATHTQGWTAQWPALLAYPLPCQDPQ
ncbi:MAG: alpha/beta hydrolase [Alphaproteobacteria bacterium]|nr:alpha/beta hydrolase [Alphaproteobacteria bacterium]